MDVLLLRLFISAAGRPRRAAPGDLFPLPPPPEEAIELGVLERAGAGISEEFPAEEVVLLPFEEVVLRAVEVCRRVGVCCCVVFPA